MMTSRVRVTDECYTSELVNPTEARSSERSRVEITDYDTRRRKDASPGIAELIVRPDRPRRRRNVVPSMLYNGLGGDEPRNNRSDTRWQSEKWDSFLEHEDRIEGRGLPFVRDKAYGKLYKPETNTDVAGRPFFEDFSGSKYYPIEAPAEVPYEKNGYRVRRRTRDGEIRSWDEFELSDRRLRQSELVEKGLDALIAEDRSGSRFSLQSSDSKVANEDRSSAKTENGTGTKARSGEDKGSRANRNDVTLERLSKETVLESFKSKDISGKYFDMKTKTMMHYNVATNEVHEDNLVPTKELPDLSWLKPARPPTKDGATVPKDGDGDGTSSSAERDQSRGPATTLPSRGGDRNTAGSRDNGSRARSNVDRNDSPRNPSVDRR